VAGLQAAQRLRRISLPRRVEGSKGWPLAKSEKVISGGSCTGVREGVQEVKRREVRLMRARRCRVIGKERKSTGNPRVGLGEGSTSIFGWRGGVRGGGWSSWSKGLACAIEIRILRIMSTTLFQPGQMIFREGDTSQEAYRILKGRVEISIAGEGKSVILAQLGEGDIFGEMAMVDERPRSASAQCLEVTECEVLTAENFNEAVLQRPEILIPYLASFFERLRTANDRLRMEMRLRARAEQQVPVAGAAAVVAPTMRVVAPATTAIAPPSLELTRVPVAVAGSPVAVAPVAPPPAGGYQSVVLTAATDHARARLPEGTVVIQKFPYRIGRKHDALGKGATVFASNDLPIADDKPYQISRNHCSIEREGDNFFVRDRGSSVGTVVNDAPIGLAEDTLTKDLQGGENEILLGADDSPFKFKITLS